MKKTFTLLMALALVTSLFAVPQNPKLQKKGEKAQPTEQVERVSFTHHTDLAVKHAAEMNIARPMVKAVAKKNISRNVERNVVRKAPMADATTFTFASSADLKQTKNGIKVTFDKGEGSSDPAWLDSKKQLRVYTGNTIKVSGSSITKVELSCSKNNGKDYSSLTADTGVLTSGGTSTDSLDVKVDTWTGDASSVTFTVGAKQRIIKQIVVTGEGGTGSDTIYLNTMEYVEAYYSGGYWDFDMYVDYDETTGLTYPEFYFMCDEEATSQTAISGEWTMYYGGVWNSENDSVEMAEGSLSVTVNLDKTYNFYGQFTGEDDNVYVVDIKNIEVGAYDADNDYAEIELDEEGGGSTVDTVVVPVNFVQAVRHDSYSSAGSYLWEIAAMNYTSPTQYDFVWFDVVTPLNNRIEGIYNIESENIYNFYGFYYYAGYTKVNGNDTTEVSAGSENIQLTVLYDEVSKAYDMAGELLSEDGKKLYMFEVEDMAIEAFDEDEKDITLMDSVEFVPDTIDITGQDAIEFAYYASYSEEGSYYNYSANLYSVANDYPYLMLDIYTATKDEFVGSYDTATNVGEYCDFYMSEESEIGVVNPKFTISKNGEVYTIAGSFTGADQNYYRFSVSAVPTMADGDHPYEPMDKQDDVNIVANSKDLVTDYVSDYSELDLYLNGENDTIQLALVTSKTTIADGTYAISTAEDPANGELIAGYYTSYGFGGCVAYVGYDVYYLVSGSLNVATANDTVTYSLSATSAHGTVINAIYKEYKAGPTPGEHTIVFADYCSAQTDTAFTTTDGVYSVIARKGTNTSTGPKYISTDQDFRTYAGNTFSLTATSEMTEIVFNISTAGLKRQAEITPTTGVMAYDMTAATVTWTGKASNVVFTVGAKNKYGSDETTKAGQFDFTSLDITLAGSGLMETSEFKVQNTKFVLNGQFVILKNGVLYNAQGQVVK